MKKNPYRVPEGYFRDLKYSIVEKADQMQVEADAAAATRPRWRVELRSASVFAASFAAVVVLGITGYYFTGYKAQQAELMADGFDETYLLYDLDEAQIFEYTTARSEEQNSLLADASLDYLDAFGYPVSDDGE